MGGLSVLGQHLVCHVLLIETPASGLVLVDTGLGTADYARITSRLGFEFAHLYARPRIDPELAAIHQVRRLGFDPRDVRHIIQTHLDLDHVGGLSDFPEATVHVHEIELAAAIRRKGVRARGRYRPKMWAHTPKWSTFGATGEPWLGFEAVRSLPGLPAEILAVPLFGHTHGHVGYVVETDAGTLLAAGDAYFDAREVKQPDRECGRGVGLFQFVVTTEYDARRANQDRLRALHADHPEIAMYCAHNPFEYRELADASGDALHGYYASSRAGLTVA
ncbi:MBL fold metallo-hydrolase [Agromyces protaetiae]|uniref:MBL fold metallo-hydrolase n=1 Tax=Agromyces protaetiae TaxID=2509455 RepID=A0A4P6FEZ5_9MICO|nr:MBL fold metallo-hydrolase [Agromyces protaetiae]